MARVHCVALVAAVVGLFAVATIAQPTTLATRWDGYTYVSNVIGYVNMTADYCDIQAAINRGNFTAALDIYTFGKNSFAGLTRRTFNRFASFVPTAGVAEPLHDALAMGRNGTWLDSLIKDAMAKRNGSLALGLVQVAALKYFLHEVDEGFTKVSIYLNDTVNNAVLISDLTGAPHNVDEAFALWAGGSAQACGTLSGWAASMGGVMDTNFASRSYINSAMTLGLNELLASSRTGNLQPYNATRFLIQRHITVMGLQAVINNTYLAQAASLCKRNATFFDAKNATIVHWTYLEPLLVVRRVPTTTIRQLQVAMLGPIVVGNPPSATFVPAFQNFATIIRSIFATLGIRANEVGWPVSERVTAGWACSLAPKP